MMEVYTNGIQKRNEDGQVLREYIGQILKMVKDLHRRDEYEITKEEVNKYNDCSI